MSGTGSPPDLKFRRNLGFRAINPKAGMVKAAPERTPVVDKPNTTEKTTENQTLSIAGIREGEDVHQVPYIPKSKMQPTGAMISSSLAAATYEALNKLVDKYGDIDEFVLTKLGMSEDEMRKAFSAEQVDSIALGISSIINNREFILGDVTGFGKGRTQAAIAAYMIREGHKVIFLSEKSHLFSDFWRDIKDIGMEDLFGIPIIMNAQNSNISNMDEVDKKGKPKILFRHEPDLIKDILAKPHWPEGRKIMFATYSQFNRGDKFVNPGDGSYGYIAKPPKNVALIEMVKEALLACDESHNIVQNSNVGITNQEAKANALAKINSSATNGRTVLELMSYGGVMPWLLPISAFGGHDFKAMGYVNRRAMAEASTVRAAREGALISRQHDMSKMVMQITDIAENNEKIISHEEAFSKAERKLAALWQITASVVKEMNANSEGVWSATPPNFGAVHSLLSQNFSVALRLEHAVETVKTKLLEGKKYIGVLSNTQESAMRNIQEAHKLYKECLETQDPEDEVPPVLKRLKKKPDFKDLILLAAHRLTRVLIREGKKTNHINLISKEILAGLDELESSLVDFPDLPISPLDYLKRRVEEEGQKLYRAGKIEKPWRAGEISGRSLGIDKNGEITNFSGEDRNATIYGFNNGGANWYDVLFLTRAGAVGTSLHDAVNFKSHGVRHMQEIETIQNVIERIQMWGRVARRGQVTDPEFSMLSSSMPGDLYSMVSQSKKVADVSAVVAGSSKSLRMVKDIPDPIDSAGERAARGILGDNPQLRLNLMISVGENDSSDEDGLDVDDKADEFATAFALLRRIRLLSPISMQKHVFDQFLRRREEIVMAYPEEPPVLAGVWKTIETVTVDPEGSYHGKIDLIKVETDRNVVPLDSKRIRAMIASNRGEASLENMANLIDQQRNGYLAEQAAKLEIDNWQNALRGSADSSIKTIARDIDILKKLTQTIKASMIVKIPDEGGQPKPVIVTRIRCRDAGKACLPRAYEIEFVKAGEDQPGRISFEPMVRMPQLYGLYEPAIPLDKALVSFDKALTKSNKITRTLLCGDPVDEVLAAIRMRGGSRASFKMEIRPGYSVWKHGILVPKHLEKRVFQIPVRVGTPDQAMDYLKKSNLPLKTDPLGAGRGLILSYEEQTYRSNAKLRVMRDGGAPRFLINQLHSTAQKLQIHHGTKEDGIRVSVDEYIIRFLDMMMAAGIPIYANGADRNYILGIDKLSNPRVPETNLNKTHGTNRMWNTALDMDM